MNNNQLINKALQYISSEWNNEQITLEKVASSAGFSLAYFDRLFSFNVGQPVIEYVRNYKLIRSAQMLRTSCKSIIDIALELGYANPESYTRAFKEQYKMPPTEYRERHKNKKLMWKDLSTGSVLRQFETLVPNLKRIDTDEAIDFMLINNPMYYLYTAYLLTQTDNAVYTIDGDNLTDFIIVDEYRPEEMTLEVISEDPERLRQYFNIAKKFANVYVDFICAPDFNTPTDELGLTGYKKLEYYNYIYLENEIDTHKVEGYTIRELVETDSDLVKKLEPSIDKSVPLMNIFRQKFEFNNYTDVQIIGLFYNNLLVGCALPTFERVRSFTVSDIGSIVISDQHKNDETLRLLWSAAIQYAIRQNAKPINFATTHGHMIINADSTEQMGYTFVSKKIAYTNIQRLV